MSRRRLRTAIVAALMWPVTGAAQVAVGPGPIARVGGAPGTYQVVAVPVPPSLSPDRSVAFEVVPSGAAPLLGALRGELASGGRGPRLVVLTIGVPSGARAGSELVARVRFSDASGSATEVPVELEVLRVRRASLTLGQAVFGGRVGERVDLQYRLTNTGNAPDSFSANVVAPSGWRSFPLGAHVLEAGSSVEDSVTLGIPRGASTGSSFVQLLVSDGAGERARTQGSIEVVDGLAQRGDHLWQITPGVATVFGNTALATPTLGLDLDGPVTRTIRLSGHLVQGTDRDPGQVWGLARLGYLPGTNALALTGPRWRLTGGHASQAFSDITGINLWGIGAAFNYDSPRWSTAALGGSPVTPGTGAAGGHLFGTQLGVNLGGGWLRGTATDALEATPGGRHLQALGVGATSPPLVFGTLLSAELAQRWFATGQGLGWLAEMKHQADGENLFMRYTHAPGGSAAFAPARDMLTAFGSRRLAAGVLLNGSVWTARDTSPAFSRLESSGWSVTPQFALTRWATLELEGRSNSFTAADSLGTFGNSETAGRVGLTTRFGRLLGTGSATLGRATRTTGFAGVGSAMASADRLELGGSLQWISRAGVFGATADYQQSGPGVGYLPQQYSVGLRADAVPLPGRTEALVNAAVQRYEWFGARPSATVVQLGLRAPFPGAVVVRVDAEHNPLFLSAGGGGGWNVAIKLEHPLSVRARSATVVGVVYEDLDGDGKRDPGEPAIQGALVRHDGESAVTDARGRFRFFREVNAAAELDEASLPFGLVANPASPPQRGEARVEIGVIPTAPVEVRLVLTVPPGSPAPSVDLGSAVVRVRNERDNLWTARPDSSGLAVFHALPPGQYRVELDLGGLREPLLTRGDLPTFRVEAGRHVPTLAIPLYPRPIRFVQPGSGAPDYP